MFRCNRQKNTETIILKYNVGPAGLETLATMIGEEVETIEDVYEPYLMQIGFISRSTTRKNCTRINIRTYNDRVY